MRVPRFTVTGMRVASWEVTGRGFVVIRLVGMRDDEALSMRTTDELVSALAEWATLDVTWTATSIRVSRDGRRLSSVRRLGAPEPGLRLA